MGRGRQLNLFFAGLAIKWRADWKRIYLRPWPKCPSAAIEWKEPPITAQNFRCRDKCKTRQVEEIWGIFCCLNFQFCSEFFTWFKRLHFQWISNNLIHLNWMKINEHMGLAFEWNWNFGRNGPPCVNGSKRNKSSDATPSGQIRINRWQHGWKSWRHSAALRFLISFNSIKFSLNFLVDWLPEMNEMF